MTTDIAALKRHLTDAGLTHGPLHDALDELARARSERDRFEAALARACLVGGTTYLVERAETAEADRDRLAGELAEARAVLETLDKAAAEVSRCGAVTGPQWSRLTIASLKARAFLNRKDAP